MRSLEGIVAILESIRFRMIGRLRGLSHHLPCVTSLVKRTADSARGCP